MKKIKTNELYRNLSGYLAGKGIELKDGSYANRIRQGCAILTDTVNFTQENLEKAKSQIDQKLDRMRRMIHEKTAPKTPPPPSAGNSRKKAKTAPRKAPPKKTVKTGAKASKSNG
jgi:hypothetical protein